jgi:hypothetical protein
MPSFDKQQQQQERKKDKYLSFQRVQKCKLIPVQEVLG